MKALGCHIIAELSHCNKRALSDIALVKDIMVRAALEAKAQIKEIALHKFSPQGVSGVIVIAESHLSIHTWPETGYAAIDIYTCGDTTDPWRACHFLAEKLEAQDVWFSEVKRGMPTNKGYFYHEISRSHVSGGVKVVQNA